MENRDETPKDSTHPIDVPDADAAEQSQEWSPVDDADAMPRRIPVDEPEADVLDQTRPADLDLDDREI